MGRRQAGRDVAAAAAGVSFRVVNPLETLRNELARRTISAASRRREVVPWPVVSVAAYLAASRDTLRHWQMQTAREPTGFALSDASLSFLRELIRDEQPRVLLEFGCGASTLALAAAAAEYGGTVISVEQNAGFVEITQRKLRAARLDARLAHCPLNTSGEYDLGPRFLGSVLGPLRPEFVLVDGPSGGGTVRAASLLAVLPRLAPGALFVLDDALRDGEIGVARRWALERSVRLQGVRLVGHGLLVGRVG